MCTHTHMVFKIQSTSAFNIIVETKMVWMSLGCEAVDAEQSSGQAEMDKLGPGIGDKGKQKGVIAWLRWRLLEANWCFSDFVWHQRFHTQGAQFEGLLSERSLCIKFIISYSF